MIDCILWNPLNPVNPVWPFLLFCARELQLALVELAVEAVLGEQLLVIADLAHVPVLQSWPCPFATQLVAIAHKGLPQVSVTPESE